jgi:photosystem II stability/assembly factor-like uncharacterized protein
MERDPTSGLSARKRRAIVLLIVSAFAIVAASLTWIIPGLHLGEATNSKTTAANPYRLAFYATTYEFATPSVGWAATPRPIGTVIFKTVDGGKHWHLASRVAGGDWATIQFLDTAHGFLLTGNPDNPSRFYRTTDGGAHWTAALMLDDASTRITFTDSRHGALFGSSGSPNPTMYTTEDGGDTWSRLPDLPQDSFAYPVIRGSEAWLGTRPSPGRPHVYASFDRGLTWSSIEVPRPTASQPVPHLSLSFTAQVKLIPSAGVAVQVSAGTECKSGAPCVRPEAAQFVSFDRGGTWKEVALPAPEFPLQAIVYQDAEHWWALGPATLFKSSDGGQTWQLVSATAPQPGKSLLHVLDAQHAWVQSPTFKQDELLRENVRIDVVFATSDGGLNWTQVIAPPVSFGGQPLK